MVRLPDITTQHEVPSTHPTSTTQNTQIDSQRRRASDLEHAFNLGNGQRDVQNDQALRRRRPIQQRQRQRDGRQDIQLTHHHSIVYGVH